MVTSMRCPRCGRPEPTRRGSVCEYVEGAPETPGRRARVLLSQTDRFACDGCGATWDEETYRRRTTGAHRPAAAAAAH
jgi:transposase-like protein